jgi:hypothetical protein
METVDRRGGLADSAEHDDRAVGKSLTHRLKKAHAVKLRHAHVRDDQGGLTDTVEHLKPFPPGAGFKTVEALGLQHSGE